MTMRIFLAPQERLLLLKSILEGAHGQLLNSSTLGAIRVQIQQWLAETLAVYGMMDDSGMTTRTIEHFQVTVKEVHEMGEGSIDVGIWYTNQAHLGEPIRMPQRCAFVSSIDPETTFVIKGAKLTQLLVLLAGICQQASPHQISKIEGMLSLVEAMKKDTSRLQITDLLNTHKLLKDDNERLREQFREFQKRISTFEALVVQMADAFEEAGNSQPIGMSVQQNQRINAGFLSMAAKLREALK